MKTIHDLRYIFICTGFFGVSMYAQESGHKVSANNAVLIEQLGNHNQIISHTVSQKGTLGLFQQGHENQVHFRVAAPEIEGLVYQKGHGHSYVAMDKRNSPHQTRVLQHGQQQNLIMLGSNGLSANMTIRMQGRKQSVLVRNFKRKR